MRGSRLWVLTLGMAAVLGGCKKSTLDQKKRDADAIGVVLPQRVVGDSFAASTATFEVDAASGRPKPTLVLRLDYFPTPEPGRTTLPSCFRSFPPDFALGEVRCVQGDGTDSVRLFAKHVDQDCYTNPDSRRAKASEPLLMVGCERAEVYAYQFDPAIRVDTEVR